MYIKIKLVLLEVVLNLFSITRIIFGILTIYFFVQVVGFSGSWMSLLWPLIGSIVSQWLSRGFLTNLRRMQFEARLIDEGYTPGEAAQKWMDVHPASYSHQYNRSIEK